MPEPSRHDTDGTPSEPPAGRDARPRGGTPAGDAEAEGEKTVVVDWPKARPGAPRQPHPDAGRPGATNIAGGSGDGGSSAIGGDASALISGARIIPDPRAGDSPDSGGGFEAAPPARDAGSWADAPRLRIGTEIGKYRLTRMLGQGGMGVVWEAEDAFLRRRVAIKFLTSAPGSGPDGELRFLREARSAARLLHPNVVIVHEVDRRGDLLYIVMERVNGGSASSLVESKGPVPWREATRIIRECAIGLSAAHAAGIIHRDIKPANVLLTADGRVKLADFGLAKILRRGDGESSMGGSAPDLRTATGMMVGTLRYMSPEQILGLTADARSDVYSLGATYFALLTARAPFHRYSGTQSVAEAQQLGDVPDPREFVRDVPEDCRRVVRRAMAKLPDFRYQDTASMIADLDAILAGRPVAATGAHAILRSDPPPVPPVAGSAGPPSRPATVRTAPPGNAGPAPGSQSRGMVVVGLAAAGATLALAGLAWSMGWLRFGPDPAPHGEGPDGPPTTTDTQKKPVTDPVPAKDPLPRFATGVRVSAHAGPLNAMAWAPAGAVDGSAGEGPGLLTAGADGRLAVWSAGAARRVRLLDFDGPDEDGGAVPPEPKTVGEPAPPKPRTVLWSAAVVPATRPDAEGAPGHGVLFAVGGADGRIRLWNASDGRPVRTLRLHKSPVWAIRPMPDGHHVISTAGDPDKSDVRGEVLLWRVADGAVVHDFAERHRHFHATGVTAAAISADGGVLATGDTRGGVRVWDLPRRRLAAHLTAGNTQVMALALSADGKRLAAGTSDNALRVWELPASVSSPAGKPPFADAPPTGDAPADRILSHPAPVWSVAWAVEGDLIAAPWERAVRVRVLPELRTGVTLDGPTDEVLCVGVRGGTVAAGTRDGSLWVWRPAKPAP